MIVKKAGGRIFGAEFTKDESKALNMEIRREMASFAEGHRMELQAIILWELHEQLGLGPERLWRFYSSFDKNLDQLVARYEMEEADDVWLATKKLAEYGINLEEWRKDLANQAKI